MLPNACDCSALSFHGTTTLKNPFKKSHTSKPPPTVSQTHLTHSLSALSLVIAWGEHLCHCCGNSYGEISSISFQWPLINKMSMTSEMQLACCRCECREHCVPPPQTRICDNPRLSEGVWDVMNTCSTSRLTCDGIPSTLNADDPQGHAHDGRYFLFIRHKKWLRIHLLF